MKYKIAEPGPPVSEIQLHNLESMLGRELPRSYRAFLRDTNGGVPGRLNFRLSGLSGEVKEFFGIRGNNDAGDLLWRRRLVADRLDVDRYLPIAETPAGDLVCLKLIDNQVAFWDHEQDNEQFQEDQVQALGCDFDEFWHNLFEEAQPPECKLSDWKSLGVGWRSAYGRSVCECAAIEGRLDVVRSWLDLGYPVGNSMRYAAINGQIEIVDFLVSRGADLNELDEDGRTPLDWASWNENIVTALRHRGAKSGEEVPH